MTRGVVVALVALAFVGVASLLAVPIEVLAPAAVAKVGSVAALRALATIQPLVLTLAAVAAGCWAAPKVGLGAPLIAALVDRAGARAVLRRQLLPAGIAGVACAALLLAYTCATPAIMGTDFVARATQAGFDLPLVTKLLYGGVGEELLTRWGVMSLLAVLAWRTAGRPARVPGWCYWSAAAAAASIFAAGHLPLLFMLAPDATAVMVLTILLGNAVPGLLFGWLFWRCGIEAAMVAHALSHLLSVALS